MSDQYQASNSSFLPTSIKQGIICGVILIVISLLTNLLSLNSNMMFLILLFVISLALYIMASYRSIKVHRDEDQGGKITFGRAFITGLVAVLVASILFSIFSIIYNIYIDPASVQETIDATRDFMEKFDTDEDAIDQQIANAEKMAYDPLSILKQNIFSAGVIGVLASLILAAILKRDSPVA